MSALPILSTRTARAMATAVLAAVAGCAAPLAELPPAPPTASPQISLAPAATPDARRIAALEALALRLRDADRAGLLVEWTAAQRSAQAPRKALLMLHPGSPVHDPDAALRLLEEVDAEERRVVLRGWAAIMAAIRQSDERAREQAERAREQAERAREQAERAREQLAIQLERQRLLLRDADRRAVDDRQRADIERLRAEALAARIEELQRTMQALRDIDRRQLDRNP